MEIHSQKHSNKVISNPLISVIIPTRNEAGIIEETLNCLLNQDFDRNKYEIIVVDGMSEDDTQNIVKKICINDSRVRLLENQYRSTPFAMNIGLKEAKGEFITKSDAHTYYPSNYLSECFKNFKIENIIWAVGGVAYATSKKNTLSSNAIALSLHSKLSSGKKGFRTKINKPILSDAAFGTMYSKKIFERIGTFNEKLKRSQDMEMNIRILNAGGKILLLPLILKYYPKNTLSAFFKHNITDGIWAILPLKYSHFKLRFRHFIPGIFIASILIAIILTYFNLIFLYILVLMLSIYLLILFIESIKIGLKNESILLIPFLFLAFLTRHFGYGIGSIIGVIKLPFA